MPNGANLRPQDALSFALIFLRTDAPGDRGKHVIFSDLCRGSSVVTAANQLDKLLHLDADRTPFNTFRMTALQAAGRFRMCLADRQAKIHFFEVVPAGLVGFEWASPAGESPLFL